MSLLFKKQYYLIAAFLPLGLIFYYSFNIHAKNQHLTEKVLFNSVLTNQWYPHDPAQLSDSIDHYFDFARKNFNTNNSFQNIKALVVPHAGHSYSGYCAASGYLALENNQSIKSIILLAPSHHFYVKGVVRPHFTHYQTPLGILEVDQTKKELFEKTPYTQKQPEAYSKEHSLEIQFPFIQKIAPQAKILPLIVGEINAESIDLLAQGIINLLDEKTIIIVSSDFMHYGSNFQYTPFKDHLKEQIVSVDQQAINAISNVSLAAFQQFINRTNATICGRNPLTLVLKVLEKQQMHGDAFLTAYYLSPQVNRLQDQSSPLFPALFLDEKDILYEQSVSYNALIFTENDNQSRLHIPTQFEEKIALTLARTAIETALQGNRAEKYILPLGASLFNKNYGAFVTLTNKKNQLRGCIGNIVTQNPLSQTIINMARAAAFNDQRFTPLQERELNELIIQISLLSPPIPIDSLDQFKVGKHGIILTKKDAQDNPIASAVFLPEVAKENNWNAEETAKQLSIKAGLAPDAWKEKSSFALFETIKISE
jgi:AmmeMemoRadiSam system protein B/AmmeMemoRadiSam system protein A